MEGLLLVEALNGLTRFKECAQQLVRLNDIAFTIVFMGINDPTPAIRRDSAAIALRSTGSRKFVTFLSQVTRAPVMVEKCDH
jgi:hypothetical protein